jgi:Bacterial archaeo-eukaryotic release factor family 3
MAPPSRGLLRVDLQNACKEHQTRKRIMQSLNDSLFRELAECAAPICLSLYMEVAAGGGDHRHVRVALKNARTAAGKAIEAAGADAAAASAVQDRLDALDYDDVTGAHDRHVAVFIAPELTEIVDARFVETGVHAGTRFRLAPLVADLEMTPEHAILVAGHDYACLYRARGGVLEKQSVEGMPESLRDIRKFTDMQEKGNIHGREDSGVPGSYNGRQAVATGKPGTEGVPHHSAGGHDWREDKEEDLRQYANQLINAAQHHLSGTNLPLIIAADERLYGMLRDYSEYPFLAEEGITLNPRDLDEEMLRQQAATCLEREVEKRHNEAWDKIAMSLGRGDREASEDPADIVTAAAAGRVAHLFVMAGAKLPGRFDEKSLRAEPAEDGPDDLVDRAITDTLRNRGDVFPLRDRGSNGIKMAAAYRYPA